MRPLPLVSGLLALALAPLPHVVAGEAKPGEVPVRKVVLFSSGVGYFEHAGAVAGAKATELRFKAAQINDVLKSLLVEDRGGPGATISYPSQDPIAKTLRSFQIDISGNPSLGELLQQLRGAKVTATVQGEQIAGTILGLEQRTKAIGDKGQTTQEWVLNLIAGGTIRAVPLDDVRKLTLDDPALDAELGKALNALAQARDQDKKPVVIAFPDHGQREVRVGYVVETPVWKTSYRLVLPSDDKAKPRLVGWAIVENQTDNDWAGIDLTLVSGRPISFVQDLYQPLYVPRPVVQPELYASLRPQTYDEGMSPEDKAVARAEVDQLRGRGMPARKASTPASATAPGGFAGPAMELAAAADAPAQRAIDPAASVASVAQAQKVGEFFEYTVKAVDLPRQRSAMLPIVAGEIACERLSIYNAGVLAKHPLLGARLVNSTANHLLAGPITVLDGGSYAGDARVDNVPPGQERLLSFAIDLQVLVDAASRKEDSAVQTGRIVSGVLHLKRKRILTQEYVVQNKADKPRSVLIEHPINHGWKLVDSPKPVETTDRLYRFTLAAAPGRRELLTVREELVQEERNALIGADLGVIEHYARTGEIPQKVRDALAKAAALKRAMDLSRRGAQERQQKLGEITQEQNRIRDNMRAAPANSELHQRLLKKLNDQESAIEKLQLELENARQQQEQQRRELEEYLANLSLE